MMPTALTHRSPDGLEVGVLERRAQHPHLVDLLAGGHQVAHDPRARPRGAASANTRVPFAVSTSTPPARLSSSGVPAATSSPRAMIATRSQTSSTSDSRCEFSSTATPCAAQLLEQPPHGAPAGGVERARRLVEQQQPRAADHRLRDPEPLLHALRHRAHAPRRPPPASPTGVEQPRRARRRRRPSPRAAGACRAARRRSASRGSGTARRGSRARGAPPASRRARRRSARSRRSAARARRRSSRASTCRRRSARAARRARPRRPRALTPLSAWIDP